MNLRLRRPLSPGRVFALCALVATVLALPSLFAGFFYDDWMQIAQLEGRTPPHGSTFDLFNFASGGAETAELIQRGPLYWWTSPDFRMHFWRPLASALIAVQYALFGYHAFAYHVVSLLLQIALIAGVAALFRRVLPSLWVSALLLFAIDDAHWDAVGWIAANNGVLALLGSVLALIAYVRYREEGWKPGLALALCATLLSLLAGEAGVGALAYLGAYELVGTRKRHLLGLWPFALLLVPYVIIYKLGGYGARDHIGYLDPIAGTKTYLFNAALRIPGLFGNLTIGLPLELWWKSDGARVSLALVGTASIVLVALWLRAAFVRVSEDERRNVLWLSLGALLSLVPSCAGPPGQRSLFIATLGAAPVIGLLLRDGRARLRDQKGLARVAAGAGFVLLVLPNVVLAPLLFAGKLVFMGVMGKYSAHMVSETERVVSEAKLPDAEVRVAVVSSDDPLTLIYVPMLRRSETAWRAFWPLSAAAVPTTLSRPDSRTLELSTSERFFATELEAGLYGGRRPHLGSSVRLDGADVTVTEEREGYPTRLAIRFDTAQDLERTQWISWGRQKVQRVELPAVGKSIAMARPEGTGLF